MHAAPALAVVVVCHDSAGEIGVTLTALGRSFATATRSIVVDNASRDGTAGVVRDSAPWATVVESAENLGFAGGCHVGVRRSSAPLVLLLNPDAAPAPGCLDALRACAAERPEWGAWQALVTMAGGELVNTAGNVVHYLGFGWAGDLGRPVADVDPRPREVGFCSGAALVVRRDAWDAVGGFDERYFMYGEDLDLSLRLRLAGWGVGIEPRARVAHDYDFAKGDYKWFYLERNRWWTLVGAYPARLLALLAPGAARVRGRAPAGGVARRLVASQGACAGGRDPGVAGDRAPPPRRAGHEADRAGGLRRTARGVDGLAVPRERRTCPRDPGAAAMVLARRPGGAWVAVHLGLDLLFLVPGASGGRETYARELTSAIRQQRGDLRVTTFINRETAAIGHGFWRDLADNVVVLRGASALDRRRWALGELVMLPRAAARERVEVLHCPANFAPLHGPFARVVTLHDLIFRRLPGTVPTPLRWGTEATVPPAARRADRIITGSEAARDDIVAELKLRREQIDVIPHGIAAPPQVPEAALARTRARLHANGRPIALSVATDVPHKNLTVLPRGLAQLPPQERPLLVFAGFGTDAGELPKRRG